jgi:lipopolysaccharide/colanic/teichoic acid biosynthesis glycosyltransferase
LTSDYTDYFDYYEDKINADWLYVGNKSLWLDLKIILKCFSHALFRRDKMITVKLNKKRIGIQKNSIFDYA